MSYRIKNQPLGTPMDLHFLTGVPHDIYMSKRATPVRHVPEPDAGSTAALPLEVVEARKHIKKRRRS